MDNNNVSNTICIKQKRYALGLVNKFGYKLLNVIPDKSNTGVVYVFERTDTLMRDFETLIKGFRATQIENKLTQYDIKTLISILQGCDIKEVDAYAIMDKLCKMDDAYSKKYNDGLEVK